jgi:hypothetical protein
MNQEVLKKQETAAREADHIAEEKAMREREKDEIRAKLAEFDPQYRNC